MPRFDLNLHDELIAYGDFIHTELDNTEWKSKNIAGLEVNYVYLKGHGWVPETPLSMKLVNEQLANAARQAAKVQNFGTPSRGGWAHMDFSEVEARILRNMQNMPSYGSWYEPPQRAPRQIPREPRREHPRQVTTTQSHQTDALRYTYSYSGNNWASQDLPLWVSPSPRTNNPPRARTEAELAENSSTRYFPGSGAAAEPQRQESIHERRLREYRCLVTNPP